MARRNRRSNRRRPNGRKTKGVPTKASLNGSRIRATAVTSEKAYQPWNPVVIQNVRDMANTTSADVSADEIDKMLKYQLGMPTTAKVQFKIQSIKVYDYGLRSMSLTPYDFNLNDGHDATDLTQIVSMPTNGRGASAGYMWPQRLRSQIVNPGKQLIYGLDVGNKFSDGGGAKLLQNLSLLWKNFDDGPLRRLARIETDVVRLL